MLILNATEVQNNFGKYLQKVIDGEEIQIVKNGKNVARIVAQDAVNEFLSDSLVGLLKEDVDLEQGRKERMKRYESVR